MATNIIIATTLADTVGQLVPLDEGTLAVSETVTQDLYISHDSAYSITGCSLYVLPYASGAYLGTATAQEDYEELLAYGDTSYPINNHEGGGLYLNMNYSGGFPSDDSYPFRTGWGDTLGNAVTLLAQSLQVGTGDDGEIPAAGKAHIKLTLEIPATEDTPGTRYINLAMYYQESS